MGIASLVLGIISIIFSFFGIRLVGIVIALVGIILGAMGRKNPNSAGVATGGLVCSIIGLILCLILYIACAACVSGGASALNSLF